MRMSFHQLFQQNPNGLMSPLVPVRVGGFTMGPGVSFGGGVGIGGVNLTQLVGQDFDVDVEDGVHVLKGVCN